MTHVTCRLTAKNRDLLRNPTLGNRLRATSAFLHVCVGAVLPRGAHAKLTHKSVLSVVNSAISMALCAFAAERRAAAPLILGARCLPLSIDISGPHGDQQQTRHTPLLRSNDGTDGRRDGRTDALPLVDPAPHTMRAVPVK